MSLNVVVVIVANAATVDVGVVSASVPWRFSVECWLGILNSANCADYYDPQNKHNHRSMFMLLLFLFLCLLRSVSILLFTVVSI